MEAPTVHVTMIHTYPMQCIPYTNIYTLGRGKNKSYVYINTYVVLLSINYLYITIESLAPKKDKKTSELVIANLDLTFLPMKDLPFPDLFL